MVTPLRADRYVEQIGVNTHFDVASGVYNSSYAAIETKLQELGVRHIRDGLDPSATSHRYTARSRMQQLYDDHGIKTTVIVRTKDAAQHLLESEIDAFLYLVSHDNRSGTEVTNTGWIHALESPNEYDKNPGDPEFGAIVNGKPLWARELISFHKEYHRQIRAYSVTTIRNKIVLGPHSVILTRRAT